MSHDHSHDSIGDLRLAFFLNLSFTIIEIAGGIWTNSLAILSDAIHDLGDSLSLGMAWYLETYARKDKDKKYSYGYRRYSLLSALINTVVLIVGSVFILSSAVARLFNPEPVDAKGMIVFAILGIIVNGLAMLRLRGGKSLNAQVVSWHLIEDVLGWVAVLIMSIVLLFTDLYILDPIFSILITSFVLYNVIKNLRKTLALFLQAVPENMDLEMIENRLLAIDNVCSSHHTHIWSMDGEHHVLTTHLVVEEDTSQDEVLCIKEDINQLSNEMDFLHTTVEIEYGAEPALWSHPHQNFTISLCVTDVLVAFFHTQVALRQRGKIVLMIGFLDRNDRPFYAYKTVGRLLILYTQAEAACFFQQIDLLSVFIGDKYDLGAWFVRVPDWHHHRSAPLGIYPKNPNMQVSQEGFPLVFGHCKVHY